MNADKRESETVEPKGTTSALAACQASDGDSVDWVAIEIEVCGNYPEA
jgi:hypothetical protein